MTEINEFVKITKEFVVREHEGFRLRVRMWKCLAPSDLNSLEFVQESLDENGEVTFDSIYNFFMTDEDVQRLCRGLSK